ncbi:MAG: hypothetical protein WAU02_04130 [Candidatus Saccharimonadales bacterium]
MSVPLSELQPIPGEERFTSPIDYVNTTPEARTFVRGFFWRHVGHPDVSRRRAGEVPYAAHGLLERTAGFSDTGTLLRLAVDPLCPEDTGRMHLMIGDIQSRTEGDVPIVGVSGYRPGIDTMTSDAETVYWLESDLPGLGYPEHYWPRVVVCCYTGETVYWPGGDRVPQPLRSMDELHALTIGRLQAVGGNVLEKV